VAELHICRPASVDLRSVRRCPTCEQRRRFVGSVAAWYPTVWTCCSCGDAFCVEEGRLPRPWARAWRQRSSSEARQRWTQAAPRVEAEERIRSLILEATA